MTVIIAIPSYTSYFEKSVASHVKDVFFVGMATPFRKAKVLVTEMDSWVFISYLSSASKKFKESSFVETAAHLVLTC